MAEAELETPPPLTVPELPDWAFPPLGRTYELKLRGAAEARVAERARRVKNEVRILFKFDNRKRGLSRWIEWMGTSADGEESGVLHLLYRLRPC